MASLEPFAALLPRPDQAARICELPYDVMSSEEARELARGNPLSFLHVSKPEIDLPAGTPLDAPAVYAKGREHFDRLRASGSLFQDSRAHYYLYRQVMGTHSQTGLVATASCREYRDGIVRKHELTRVDKEDDRVRHIEALASQTGPVFLTYRAVARMDELVRARTAGVPDVDFTAPDGVRHTAWTIREAADEAVIRGIFASVPVLYIADGHHRSAAASRVDLARAGAGQAGRFLAVVFPHNQMQILPYHRVLKDLNGQGVGQVLERLSAIFETAAGEATSPSRHEVGFLIDGRWHRLRFRSSLVPADDPIGRLDVTLLQRRVLDPVFGIADPRTSQRIQFVGGIRGPRELERLVGTGQAACAFAMHPTGIEDLMAIADAGGIMPPKSTWFEPKLRDAMFCHLL